MCGGSDIHLTLFDLVFFKDICILNRCFNRKLYYYAKESVVVYGTHWENDQHLANEAMCASGNNESVIIKIVSVEVEQLFDRNIIESI